MLGFMSLRLPVLLTPLHQPVTSAGGERVSRCRRKCVYECPWVLQMLDETGIRRVVLCIPSTFPIT